MIYLLDSFFVNLKYANHKEHPNLYFYCTSNLLQKYVNNLDFCRKWQQKRFALQPVSF